MDDRITILDDALLLPWSGRQLDATSTSHRAGVYDRAGEIVAASVLRRRDKPVRLFALAKQEPTDIEEAEAIFAGHWVASFGHFLLESLSRAWFIRQRPDLPLCWIGREQGVTIWQRQILDLLGITNRIWLCDRPTRVRQLHVAAPGFHIGRFFLPDQMAALGRRPCATPVAGKRVWLSRSALPDGIVIDEPAIEARLSADWLIYHPERHSIAEQLTMLADAERIAGFEGSALHAVVLMREVPARIDLFCRSGVLNSNYEIIADRKGLDQHVHIPVVTPLGGKGNAANFQLVDPGIVERTLAAG